MTENAKERLIRYARIETASDPTRDTTPSSAIQWDLLHVLEDEMNAIGLTDVSVDEHGYLFGTLESNVTRKVPTLGLLAHVDTIPNFPGKCNPKVFTYSGGDVVLQDGIVMEERVFPFLRDLVGKELITTDGTTLLGADDKAGIAEIMTAMEHLIQHPEIPHGRIRVGFTPDEEIGRGPLQFDVKRFQADFAFTVDGGELGELEYETFNAAAAMVHIRGENIHPGSAKDKMINAIGIAMELHQMLPAGQRPEYTEGYEGFFHLDQMSGNVEHADMEYIIRDHDREKFEQKKALFRSAVEFLNQKYGNRLTLDLQDTYYNMKEILEKRPEILQLAKDAMAEAGISPILRPVRGGTDGSQLSYMGLPTPNLFTGGMNAHGKYEFAVTEWMDASVDVLVRIARLLSER